MKSGNQLVNAWIFLNEDEPSKTNYNSATSCFQTLIKNNVYQAVDILYLCFAETVPTSAATVPAGNGSSYTIRMGASPHPNGLTNQNYMDYVIRDARKNNPSIKIAMTLVWGDPNQISNIFSNTKVTPQQNAANFAANLLAYLKKYNLDGFDIDWEPPLSGTSENQITLLLNAIGTEFRQQTNKHYYLTLSPVTADNLDGGAVNKNVDFLNLQLYGGTDQGDYIGAGINQDLLAYGAKFEATDSHSQQGYQTAQEAYNDNQTNYHFNNFTNWRLNSSNFAFEQAQQKILYQLVH